MRHDMGKSPDQDFFFFFGSLGPSKGIMSILLCRRRCSAHGSRLLFPADEGAPHCTGAACQKKLWLAS